MILVTGGTGLVGSNLLLELSTQNIDFIATKRNTSNLETIKKLFINKNRQNEFEQIKWINIDLLEYILLNDFFESSKITKIYHCAAQISYRKQDDAILLENNVTSTKNIVNLSLIHKIEKLCYVSSIATLGSSINGNEITEKTDFNTEDKNSGYSISKYYAELEVWRGITEGLNAVIINPSVILGAGNWESGSSTIFSTIYKGLKFYTKGTTGFIDVQDVSSIMIKLMNSDINSERFIINSENIGYFDFFNTVATALKVKAPYILAKKNLTEFAWRFEYIKSIMLNKQPVITSNSARTSQKTLLYSNNKIKKAINFNFTPINDSIKYYSQQFLKENK